MTQLFLRATPLAELMPRACRHAAVWSPMKGENDDAASVFQLGKNIGVGSVGGQNEKTFDIVG
jgi:hypothetical protein